AGEGNIPPRPARQQAEPERGRNPGSGQNVQFGAAGHELALHLEMRRPHKQAEVRGQSAEGYLHSEQEWECPAPVERFVLELEHLDSPETERGRQYCKLQSAAEAVAQFVNVRCAECCTIQEDEQREQ